MRLVLNTAEVERAINAMRVKSPPAIVRSLNRGMSAGKTQIDRDTAKDMRLKVGRVREGTRLVKATFTKLRASITATLKRVPAIEFGARGPEPSRGQGRGVTVKLPARRYPHAFIATVGRGRHRGVFERKTKKRLPIREVFGPSVWFVAVKNASKAAPRVLEQTLKTLQHEMTRILPSRGRR